MTTTQAAAKAAELRNTGMAYRLISKELAKEGYVSFKTGRMLTEAAVWNLVKQHGMGHKFDDMKRRKHENAHVRYMRRGPRAAASASTILAATAPKNNDLSEEQDARAALTLAAEHLLKALFGVPMRVTLPLDRAFRVTHD